MKLALIRRQFSATGGAELYLQRLLGALVKAGHEPHLFAEAWEGAAEGVTLHRVPVSGSRAEKPVRFAHAVKDAVAREKFDCVFSLERTIQQDVYRAGDGVHRVWLQRRREFAPWWKRPLIGLGAFHRNMMALEAQTFDPANTRHVIVNSEMVKREILEHFKFPAERIHLVRNGVDVARFQSGKRAETRARFGVKDDEFLLLFVGSGWERKGLSFLVRALRVLCRHAVADGIKAGVREFGDGVARVQAQLAGMHTSGLGERSEEPALEWNKVKLLVVGKGTVPADAPREIIFAGPMTDVEDAYAAADLFVFLPIYEPSANVVFEALAAGLPVITTAFNGAGEIIEQGRSGTILADPSDVESVVRSIGQWWSRRFTSPVVDERLFSMERHVFETMQLLELAASEKRA